MRKQKKSKRRSVKKSFDWVHHIEKDVPRLVVPVGPRFQATVPEVTNCSDDDSCWLGVKMWPNSEITASSESDKIGKGKKDSCVCANPGSVKCVNLHVAEERKVLMSELGPAFNEWKLDTMGEEVAKSWTVNQQKSFDSLVKMNPEFMNSALVSFPSKTQEEIVNYYLNVHIPRRFGQKIRSGSLLIDTDDESDDTAEVNQKKPRVTDDDGSENVKPRYLAGKR